MLCAPSEPTYLKLRSKYQKGFDEDLHELINVGAPRK